MLVQTLMSLAAPWPLKVIIDDVVGNHPAPVDLVAAADARGRQQTSRRRGRRDRDRGDRRRDRTRVLRLQLLHRESGAWVANDLRVRVFHRLQLFSLGYFDHNRVGAILSTIMTDVQTIQSFASVSTPNIW